MQISHAQSAKVQDPDFEESAPFPTSDSEEEVRVVPSKHHHCEYFPIPNFH